MLHPCLEAGWQVDTEGSEEDFLAKGHASREMLSEFVRATYTAVKHPILEDGGKQRMADCPGRGGSCVPRYLWKVV